MKKTIKYSILGLAALCTVVLCGGYYMLGHALKPEGLITRSRNIAESYNFMFEQYPELQPWVDSLVTVGALKDFYIENDHGETLHALYVAATHPTPKTAVIVHGYTDNAVRMLMIGYLYNKEMDFNILLPDLYGHGMSEGNHAQMGWKDRLDVLQWTETADELFGPPYRQRSIPQHRDGSARYLHGSRHHHDGIRRSGAWSIPTAFHQVFRRRLRLHKRMGRVSRRTESTVQPARLPSSAYSKLALPARVRMGLPGSLCFGASKEMYFADALHPRRCRHLCADVDGLSPLRSQARTQRIMDCARCHACYVLQGLSAGIHRTCKEIRRKIHTLM